MESLDTYLTELESRAERAYAQTYRAEYLRLYDPKRTGDRDRLLYWSELAHRAAKAEREKVLMAAYT